MRHSYNDEMRSMAIQHLCQVGLQFDESKSSNPFAYFTTVVNNVFTRVFNAEKKQQSIRDDILWSAGVAPSSTKQIEWELNRIGMIDLPPIERKRGRPRVKAGLLPRE